MAGNNNSKDVFMTILKLFALGCTVFYFCTRNRIDETKKIIEAYNQSINDGWRPFSTDSIFYDNCKDTLMKVQFQHAIRLKVCGRELSRSEVAKATKNYRDTMYISGIAYDAVTGRILSLGLINTGATQEYYRIPEIDLPSPLKYVSPEEQKVNQYMKDGDYVKFLQESSTR